MNGIKLENFSNYWIFPDLGMIWSIPRRGTEGGWIGSPNEEGYWQVTLTDDNGEQKHFRLARVIWESVNGKILENMEINHKSERKDENFIANLELVDRKTNINYGTRTTRAAESMTNGKLSKQVGAYKDGILVMTFPSTAEAGRQGFSQSAVSKACHNRYLREGNNTYKDYQWKYLS